MKLFFSFSPSPTQHMKLTNIISHTCISRLYMYVYTHSNKAVAGELLFYSTVICLQYLLMFHTSAHTCTCIYDVSVLKTLSYLLSTCIGFLMLGFEDFFQAGAKEKCYLVSYRLSSPIILDLLPHLIKGIF